jgi:uncharacterized protein (DUF2126 family)
MEAAAFAPVPGAGRQPRRLRLPLGSLPTCAAYRLPLYSSGRPDRTTRPIARYRLKQQPVTMPSKRRPARSTAGRADAGLRRRAHGDGGRAARRRLCVFMPPVERSRIISNCSPPSRRRPGKLGLPVHIEGYAPPHDPRINVIRVAPDPGVIEVNIHPASSWGECVATTEASTRRRGRRGSAPTSS